MKTYTGNSKTPSGVTAYELGADRITVRFRNGNLYTYTYASAGSYVVGHMKRLAGRQRGLSTFIARKKPGGVGKWF